MFGSQGILFIALQISKGLNKALVIETYEMQYVRIFLRWAYPRCSGLMNLGFFYSKFQICLFKP